MILQRQAAIMLGANHHQHPGHRGRYTMPFELPNQRAKNVPVDKEAFPAYIHDLYLGGAPGGRKLTGGR